jgi:hypothetical protein
MPHVYEIRYPDQSQFFAKKMDARKACRAAKDEDMEIIDHEFEPTQEGIASLLNDLLAVSNSW